MIKIYETPEIMVTRFDVNVNVMAALDMETSNEGPGDGWNAGIGEQSAPDPGNTDLWP